MVRFGQFALDQRTWTLTRDDRPVDLSPRLVEILAHLISQNGAIVTKEELLERFWPDTFVAENTLARAIADIRKALDDDASKPMFVQTRARRGYRFVGTAIEEPGHQPGAVATPSADPLRQWVDGRLALESLDLSLLRDATRAFERTAADLPAFAPAHAGLANAYLLQFEATRPANVPDRGMLARAVAAAREATVRDPHLGEGWAVLGHALALDGRLEDARAAVLAAVRVEPGSWRHHFRLALASWGEERLRETDRVLSLAPECAAAHLLAAMVFIARGALERAGQVSTEGVALQRRQTESAILPAAGLDWVDGLVHAARGEYERASVSFTRERLGPSGRLYAREFIVNADIALGFVRVHIGDRRGGVEAFEHALAVVPGSARATLGLFACGAIPSERVDAAVAELAAGQKAVEAQLVRAAVAAHSADPATAVSRLSSLLGAAPPGPTGWNLRADPMFLPLRDAPGFDALLSIVAARAA